MATLLATASEEPVTGWGQLALPEPGWPAGYAALIDHFALPVPVLSRPAMIAARHAPDESSAWQVLPRRLKPDDTIEAHLEFALKNEGVSLAVLKALFDEVSPQIVAEYVRRSPTGKYARRIWFLYEWLTGKELDVPDVGGRPSSVDAVDTSRQVGLDGGETSSRHAVRDNLPGTRAFCPMVAWTPYLKKMVSARLDVRAREVVGRTHPDILARAAAFLLLDDSRSSFEIEDERPSLPRVRRWGRAISEAGSVRLSVEELVRLQRIVVGDDRFIEIGLRREGGFVGDRDRRTKDPLPRHISARPEDLDDLVRGIVAYDERVGDRGIDPVIAAATLAFGFVYVHPFQDGNGRVHRWLVHHVLARAGFNPPELPFPISAAVLRNLTAYKNVLESYSLSLLDCIEYEITDRKNVRVVNETADFYRYFDATKHAEFLYRCVAETVEIDLPREVTYLEAYDAFAGRIQDVVDMPADTIDLLHRFLEQNDGRLSNRARSKEFAALTHEEVAAIEAIFAEVHGA